MSTIHLPPSVICVGESEYAGTVWVLRLNLPVSCDDQSLRRLRIESRIESTNLLL